MRLSRCYLNINVYLVLVVCETCFLLIFKSSSFLIYITYNEFHIAILIYLNLKFIINIEQLYYRSIEKMALEVDFCISLIL